MRRLRRRRTATAARLESAPDGAVTVAIDCDNLPEDPALIRELMATLPEGSTLLSFTAEQRAAVEHDLARWDSYHPDRPMHGPWTRELDRTIREAPGSMPPDCVILLVDNGFGGLMFLPRTALAVSGPVPPGHPLLSMLSKFGEDL